MSGKWAAALLAGGTAVLLAACAPVQPAVTVDESLIPTDSRTSGSALATACTGRGGWSDAAPPARIFGNTYYVGTCGISVLLVTSPQGHVLIDGATAEAVPSILANIRTLGFDPRNVKTIVGSHEHIDHMGGFAALRAATGASIFVSGQARAVVETGNTDAADPQFGLIPDMVPVEVAGAVQEDTPLLVGVSDRGWVATVLNAVATPGHTSGGTSWTWRSCEGTNCATFAYIDSMTPVSREGYRFSDHPERVAPFRETFARVSRLPCDILVTPHPGVSNLFQRMSGAEPLIDRDACRRLVHTMRTRLDARLAQEAQP